MENTEGSIVNKLKRLSLQSPPQPSSMEKISSLLLSDDMVKDIIAVTSSPMVTTPLPIFTSGTASRTNVSADSSVVVNETSGVLFGDGVEGTDSSLCNTPEQTQLPAGLFDSCSLLSPIVSPHVSVISQPGGVSSSLDASPKPVMSPSAASFTTVVSPSVSSFAPVDSQSVSNSTPIASPSASTSMTTGFPSINSSSTHSLSLSELQHEHLERIARELELTKKLLVTACSKYDVLIKNIKDDFHGKFTKIESWINNNNDDMVNNLNDSKRDTMIQVEEFVNSQISSSEKRVQEFVNNKIDEFKDNRSPQFTPRSRISESSIPDSIPEGTRDLQEQLQKQLHDLDVRLLECEQYPRRESIVISGIPNCVQQGELEDVALQIFQELGINAQHEDISAIHRLGKPNRRYPTRVIVRFVNRKFAELCLKRQDKLVNLKRTLKMNLRFFESLATLNQESVRICDYLQEHGMIQKFYLRNGFVKIIVGANDNPLRINHPDVLRKMFVVPASVT